MSELAILNTAIQSIKSAQEITKLIRDGKSSLKDAEVNMKFSNLLNALSDTQVEIANIKTVIVDKNKIISELNEKLKIKSKISYIPPYYFLIEGENKDGPYCQKCFDSDDNLVRLQKPHRKGFWTCLNCKNNFKDSDFKDSTGPVSVKRSRISDGY